MGRGPPKAGYASMIFSGCVVSNETSLSADLEEPVAEGIYWTWYTVISGADKRRD